MRLAATVCALLVLSPAAAHAEPWRALPCNLDPHDDVRAGTGPVVPVRHLDIVNFDAGPTPGGMAVFVRTSNDAGKHPGSWRFAFTYESRRYEVTWEVGPAGDTYRARGPKREVAVTGRHSGGDTFWIELPRSLVGRVPRSGFRFAAVTVEARLGEIADSAKAVRLPAC